MVKPATKTAKKKAPKPDRGIVIDVGWQNDGGVYMLDPLSEDLIHEKYPDAIINPGILLGTGHTGRCWRKSSRG
jgi:hypothetical protein